VPLALASADCDEKAQFFVTRSNRSFGNARRSNDCGKELVFDKRTQDWNASRRGDVLPKDAVG
jgi:hypothetical protein